MADRHVGYKHGSLCCIFQWQIQGLGDPLLPSHELRGKNLFRVVLLGQGFCG